MQSTAYEVRMSDWSSGVCSSDLNNAAVTADGGEIGRAQALQSRACGIAPTTDMNPVLLKPQREVGAQVVVQGRVVGNAKAREYQAMKGQLLPRVLERSEEHTSELQSLMRISYAVFCLKKKKQNTLNKRKI